MNTNDLEQGANANVQGANANVQGANDIELGANDLLSIMSIDDVNPSTSIQNNPFESALDMIRLNSINRSDYHVYNYLWLKRVLYAYRIPIIVISGCNAFIASSTQPYIKQSTITTISTVLSLVCGIVTSVEMFFNIQGNLEAEHSAHKKYYELAVCILEKLIKQKHDLPNGQSVLTQEAEPNDLSAFTAEMFKQYMRVHQSSSIVNERFDDILTPTCPLVPPMYDTDLLAENPPQLQMTASIKGPRKKQSVVNRQITTTLVGSPSRIHPANPNNIGL